jgi:hypothetical protein
LRPRNHRYPNVPASVANPNKAATEPGPVLTSSVVGDAAISWLPVVEDEGVAGVCDELDEPLGEEVLLTVTFALAFALLLLELEEEELEEDDGGLGGVTTGGLWALNVTV